MPLRTASYRAVSARERVNNASRPTRREPDNQRRAARRRRCVERAACPARGVPVVPTGCERAVRRLDEATATATVYKERGIAGVAKHDVGVMEAPMRCVVASLPSTQDGRCRAGRSSRGDGIQLIGRFCSVCLVPHFPFCGKKPGTGTRRAFISSFGDQILDFFLKRGPNRRFLSETGTKGWFIFQFGGQRAISRRFGDQNPIPPKSNSSLR